jgi:hypothetical protein
MPIAESQGLLQGVTFGASTNYHFDVAHLSGIGVPPPKTQDVDLDHGDGGYAGVDRKGVRAIIIPFVIIGTSPSNAMDNFETLAAAFEPVSADVTLELYLPGKHFTVSGRPRGLNDESLARLKSSVITAVGLFVALNPTMTAV